MIDRIHVPTFVWGVVFTVFGIVFSLEAAEVWEFTFGDLRYAGPLVLVAIGVIMVFTARRPTRRTHGMRRAARAARRIRVIWIATRR